MRKSLSVAGPWRTAEFAIESDRDRDDPYADVEVVATFTGPGGEEIRRPAFWDGGRTWRVRFAPTRPGIWRYETASSDAGDRGLNGRQGDLTCGSDPGRRLFEQHGFLRPSPDGHHLEHTDGTPFFWLGDTHWRLTAERWAESNKEGWPSQFRGTVDRRVAQGFTVYQTNVLTFEWPQAENTFVSRGDGMARLDVVRLRSELDPRMAYIAERGLLNALGLAWHGAIDEGAAGMARFARYLVARYGAYPMVWTLGGEVPGYDPTSVERRLEGWREVALAIRDADAYDHPRTAHLTAERPIPSYFQDEDWLTLTLNQMGHGDVDPRAAHYAAFRASHPGRPIVEGESMYEGLTSVEYSGRRTVTDTMVRHVAYRAIQAGCCGYTYGAQGVWNGAWDFGDLATSWGDLPWYLGVDLPGAEQLRHLRRFFESVGWHALRPDPNCFATENVFNTDLYLPDMSSSPGRGVVVGFFAETYRSGGGAATLKGLAASPYELAWFDPREGSLHRVAERATPTDGLLAVPDKPDDRDWLLVARALPAPVVR
jgi:hypothetical protein